MVSLYIYISLFFPESFSIPHMPTIERQFVKNLHESYLTWHHLKKELSWGRHNYIIILLLWNNPFLKVERKWKRPAFFAVNVNLYPSIAEEEKTFAKDTQIFQKEKILL